MVRIGSRKWTAAQVEQLAVLIDGGSTAASAAVAMKRSHHRASQGAKPRQVVSSGGLPLNQANHLGLFLPDPIVGPGKLPQRGGVGAKVLGGTAWERRTGATVLVSGAIFVVRTLGQF
jgi:hypothetical protein